MSLNCSRCQQYETEIVDVSDSLNAADTELKASRQVISLLQRQLELFQIEKDGLEKLIVAQSQNPLDNIASSCSKSEPDSTTYNSLIDLENSSDSTQDNRPTEAQKKLHLLIQTQLYAKDEEIVKLKSSLKESQNEKEQLKLQLHMLEDDVSKLRTENTLLRENLALRDQTIVSLSNEVFEQSNSTLSEHNFHRRQSSAETFTSQKNPIKTPKNIAKLVDTLEAYKKTNELLSQNVIKLTNKCAQAERKEIETRSQCQEYEAKCCQIQSKLLSLLKEIEQSSKVLNKADDIRPNQEVIQSEPVKMLIKRLLEDDSLDIPLSWKEGNNSKRSIGEETKSSKLEYDELGFYTKDLDDYPANVSSNDSSPISSYNHRNRRPLRRGVSEGTYLSHLAPVEEANEFGQQGLRAPESVDSTKKDEASWRSEWDEFIKDLDKIDLVKSKEFKTLLRSGVPQEYRCKVWKALVHLKVGKERERHGPDYYQSLLQPKQPKDGPQKPSQPASKQIELDLLRTLPNNKYFETLDSPGTIRLRKVLTAYSNHKPEVGYCQGMNRLAAVALLILPEEEAFWCLVAILDHIMPIGYYNDLWLAQVDSTVVMDLVAQKLPELSDHIKINGIELSLFAWFLTIFVDGTPPALFLRLWDCFLYEGDKVMFRVALALMKQHENILLGLNNSVSFNNYLRSTVNAPMDIDEFFKIAFDKINPLSGRSVRSRREQNFQAMRATFRSEGKHRETSVRADREREVQSTNDDDDYDGSLNRSSSIISI